MPGNQEVGQTLIGKSLRDAAARPLNPQLAAQLIVRAADMIDGLGATLLKANEVAVQLSEVAGKAQARAEAAEAALEQAQQENRDLAERLSKAQEAMDSIAEGSRGACSGSDC